MLYKHSGCNTKHSKQIYNTEEYREREYSVTTRLLNGKICYFSLMLFVNRTVRYIYTTHKFIA